MSSYKGITVTSTSGRCNADICSIVSQTPKFRKWVDSLDLNRIGITEFDITDIDWFCGPPFTPSSNLGFIKGKCMYSPSQEQVFYQRKVDGTEDRKIRAAGSRNNAIDLVTKKIIPGNIVFIRGGAVAVLIVVTVEETNESFVVLCSQPRVPAGSILDEIPAGMLDASSNVTLVALKELEEETGMVFNTGDLTNLGSFYPSPGGCDEEITLFYTEKRMSRRLFEEKKEIVFGEIHGEHDEGIRLKFVDVEDFEHTLPAMRDSKAEIAWSRSKNMGLLNKYISEDRKMKRMEKLLRAQVEQNELLKHRISSIEKYIVSDCLKVTSQIKSTESIEGAMIKMNEKLNTLTPKVPERPPLQRSERFDQKSRLVEDEDFGKFDEEEPSVMDVEIERKPFSLSSSSVVAPRQMNVSPRAAPSPSPQYSFHYDKRPQPITSESAIREQRMSEYGTYTLNLPSSERKLTLSEFLIDKNYNDDYVRYISRKSTRERSLTRKEHEEQMVMHMNR